MKKSNQILPFEILTLLIFLTSLIYTIYKISTPPKTLYQNEKSITGTITNCQKNKITLEAKEKIIINDYNNFNCQIGLKITAEGKLTPPQNNTIFNLFNYKNYLLSQNIKTTFKVTKITKLSAKIPLKYQIKNQIINYVNTFKSKKYINAFILGNTKQIEEDVLNSYQNNGINHLLAISGMHITLLSLIILFILKQISKNEKLNYLIVITLLFFYAFLVNFTPPVTRALLLFIALTIKKAFELKTKTIYFLILICAILLLKNPYNIYNIGFLFSFIVSFYLILFQNIIKERKNYIKKTFIISLIAFIAGIPILIINFHTLNLLSPFINLIFVPLVSIIIYPLSLLTLIIHPLDNLLYPLTQIMENMSLNIEKITTFTLTLKHINLTIVILYYILITYTIKNLQKNKYAPLITLIVILIIHSQINLIDNTLKVTILDVGQGDSILLKFPHNEANILIDTGGVINHNNEKPYNIAKNKIIPYLKSEGINKLDCLVTTHGDNDHIGEAENLIKDFKINKVIFNIGSYNEKEKSLIKILNQKKIKYTSSIKQININKYKLQFLNTKTYENENDNSNVIYLNYNNYKFLFMADASAQREKDILKKYNLKNIDFLKVGHHGSKTSSSKNFINSVSPKYSLISVGENNRYGHPTKEALKNLKQSKIYRTDKDGSIKITIKPKGYSIKTCNPKKSVDTVDTINKTIKNKNKIVV